MLQVRDITKWFGDVKVLDRINFNLNRGDRAGLIGSNGCGKTTLLRIITGELAPDRGSVQRSPATIRLGYLPQALDFPPGATVGDVLRSALGEREAAETRLDRLAEAVAAARDDALPAALAAYDRALAEFQALGGARREADADAVLAGLGMPDVDQSRPVSALSGGQKTRLGLARLLLAQPDLLLLDEPTNHLDIVALDWLEGFLADYDGAVLIVSHDRAFLDRTVSRTLALDDATHTLREYPGGYSAYAMAIDRGLEKQWATYREQQERFRKLEASIRKLSSQAKNIEGETIHFYWRRIAKDLARHAVVQKARLERMMASEETVEKPGQSWKMKLEFADTPRSGQDVLRISNLRVGYGGRALLEDVELHLGYGERAVLIGPNGAGKTTLLRCITGQAQALGRRGAPGPRGAGGLHGAGAGNAGSDRDPAGADPRGRAAGRNRGAELSPLLPVRRRRSFRAGGPAKLGRAQPAGVGAAGGAGLQLPAARRADQPSRHPLARALRTCHGALRGHRVGGRPRPLLHRTAGDDHLGAGGSACARGEGRRLKAER